MAIDPHDNMFTKALEALNRLKYHESDRPRDDFNIVTEALVAARGTYDEEAEKERNHSALCYSSYWLAQQGIYGADTTSLIENGFIAAPIHKNPRSYMWENWENWFQNVRDRLSREMYVQAIIPEPISAVLTDGNDSASITAVAFKRWTISYGQQHTYVVCFATDSDQRAYESALEPLLPKKKKA